ncbi:phage terminase small subunit [Streptomyces sp. NPDC005133]
MAVGGARGPKTQPHKPRSRHRTDEASEWTYLPPGGCIDPVPDPPKGRAWSDHELERWTELWSSPIAEAWDEQMSGLVAAYVIAVSVTLTGRIYAQLVGEKRQLANDLLLTPGAMARAHYRIGEPTTDGRMAAVHSLRVGA